MNRILVSVEGQTEELFVRHVLQPHFLRLSTWITATRICTRIVDDRRQHRGGHGHSFTHIERDLRKLLGDSQAQCVTTIYDLYAFPSIPGAEQPAASEGYERADRLESQLSSRFRDPRFIPFLAIHEFEAILFSSPAAIANEFPMLDIDVALNDVRREFQSPEAINTDQPPSKRLAVLIPQYRKPAHGFKIAAAIGLEQIRHCCVHFAAWIDKLEAVAAL